MEAATAPGAGPLTRDGAVPAIPTVADPSRFAREAIDGVVRCSCCGRHPLLGERVVRHEGRKGAAWVCECCERGGRGARIGAVMGEARIRSLGGAMNVRRLA